MAGSNNASISGVLTAAANRFMVDTASVRKATQILNSGSRRPGFLESRVHKKMSVRMTGTPQPVMMLKSVPMRRHVPKIRATMKTMHLPGTAKWPATTPIQATITP